MSSFCISLVRWESRPGGRFGYARAMRRSRSSPEKTDWTRPPLRRERFGYLKQRAFEAVGEARKRVENRWRQFTPNEQADAAKFLGDLRNEARASGKPRGDRPTAAETRRMLRIFLRLSRGETAKQIAADDPRRFTERQRSLSVLLRRFSRRVHEAAQSAYHGIPPKYLDPQKPSMTLAAFFGSYLEWPGVDPQSREHARALAEALRRYRPRA
jgi:hypothetical protein